jgi:trk system potassium uptake protein TrkH
MHTRRVLRFIGLLVFFVGLSMALALLVSLIHKEPTVRDLVVSMVITCSAGAILFLVTKGEEVSQFSHRDGVAIVALGWFVAGAVGALPFLLSGSIDNFTDAYFESVSGFTTTGASILNDIEKLPKGILMWRSIIQWLGGMGIIVLSIAILPFLGIGGMQLYKAEIPSPVVDKLKPRISDTAKVLWKVYILITVLEILLLLGGGMSLFDSVCHTFCTMPTGGFSPRNRSLAHYDSPYFDGVIVVFMLLAAINFALHYRLLTGEAGVFGRDPECRVFLGLVGVLTLLVTFDIYGSVYPSLTQAFRYAAFQVSSLITTTGFVTADYDTWPSLSRCLLVLSMFFGGMAGSTGGGLKTVRLIVMAKHAYEEVFRIIHPHAVRAVKLGGKPVAGDILSGIWGFFFLYLTLYAISTLVLAGVGMDPISAFSAVAACIFNVGPGLGLVGPTQNYLAVPLVGKWVLMLCMILGRLEIYTVIVLFMPEYWRK